jgi:hypothetical protein
MNIAEDENDFDNWIRSLNGNQLDFVNTSVNDKKSNSNSNGNNSNKNLTPFIKFDQKAYASQQDDFIEDEYDFCIGINNNNQIITTKIEGNKKKDTIIQDLEDDFEISSNTNKNNKKQQKNNKQNDSEDYFDVYNNRDDDNYLDPKQLVTIEKFVQKEDVLLNIIQQKKEREHSYIENIIKGKAKINPASVNVSDKECVERIAQKHFHHPLKNDITTFITKEYYVQNDNDNEEASVIKSQPNFTWLNNKHVYILQSLDVYQQLENMVYNYARDLNENKVKLNQFLKYIADHFDTYFNSIQFYDDSNEDTKTDTSLLKKDKFALICNICSFDLFYGIFVFEADTKNINNLKKEFKNNGILTEDNKVLLYYEHNTVEQERVEDKDIIDLVKSTNANNNNKKRKPESEMKFKNQLTVDKSESLLRMNILKNITNIKFVKRYYVGCSCIKSNLFNIKHIETCLTT